MNKVILTILLFISHLSAQNNIDQHFKDYFYNGELSARHCGQNISNFVQYLSNNNFKDIANIQVVSMTSPSHPWSFGRVVSMQSRWSGNANGFYSHQNFDFHVFAIYKGHVYDFHYTNEPTIHALDEYLEKMYVPPIGFQINGSSFRVRGTGPVYTPQHAWDELKDSIFKLMTVNAKGEYSVTEASITFEELLGKNFQIQ